MFLDLSDEQMRELEQALDLHLDRLQAELVHTDDRAFRHELSRRYDILESVRQAMKRQDRPARPIQPVYSPVSDFPER
jgi:hypothetical protein